MSGPHEQEDQETRRGLGRLFEALPVEPMSELFAERARRKAQAALSAERQRAEAPALVRAARLAWSRVLLPSMVAAVVVVYFGWAVRAASALYR